MIKQLDNSQHIIPCDLRLRLDLHVVDEDINGRNRCVMVEVNAMIIQLDHLDNVRYAPPYLNVLCVDENDQMHDEELLDLIDGQLIRLDVIVL